MKRSVLKCFARHGVCLAALLVSLTGLVGICRAQAAGAAAQPAKMAAQPAATPAMAAHPAAPGKRQPGGNHEGIKVHGHWVIEVKNPDGTVTARREFENKLEGAEGAQLIMSLLGGAAVKAQWMVVLPVPCSTADFCVLGETGDPTPQSVPLAADLTSSFGGATTLNCQSAPAGTCLQTLGLTINNPIGSIVLAGSVVASTSGSIGAVETALQECYATNIAIAACTQFAPSNVQYFTGTTITAASFGAGQTVSVTVTISFQ